MKLREHLYLLSGGVYGKLGNVYALQHDSGYILIDCGRYDALDIIRQNMAYWNISEHKITHVLLTHGHDDHAGSSSWFQSMGAQIYVGAGDEKNMITGNFGPGKPIYQPCDATVSSGCMYSRGYGYFRRRSVYPCTAHAGTYQRLHALSCNAG